MVRNAILLTLDALGAGHVGHLGYERNTTPRMDELARDSLRFETCLAQSSHTRESMPSLFASAYPSQLGGVGSVPSTRPTLPEVLSSAGVATAGFHSNPYLSRAYGFDRGFDRFDDDLPLANNRIATHVHRVVNHFKDQPYLRGEAVNTKGLDWLVESNADRRFLWLHYMDPHGPYQAPAAYQRLFRDEVVGQKRAKRLWRRTVDEPETITETERALLVDLYDAEIRYADAIIGDFIDTLEARGLLDESLVLIAADHGDAFGEHGYYGHPRRVYEELVHVPMVLVTPEGRSSSTNVPVENLDIAPTILDALNLTVPESFEGSSLLRREFAPANRDGTARQSDQSNPVAISEATGEGDDEGLRWTAIRTSGAKLHVVTNVKLGEVQETTAYDLTSDPTESNPIEDDTFQEGLHETYRDYRERVRESAASGEQPDEVSSVVADRLEDLGYR